jgi:hypothetical protein
MLSPFQYCRKDIKGTSTKRKHRKGYHSQDSNMEPSECEERVAINHDVVADVNSE